MQEKKTEIKKDVKEMAEILCNAEDVQRGMLIGFMLCLKGKDIANVDRAR